MDHLHIFQEFSTVLGFHIITQMPRDYSYLSLNSLPLLFLPLPATCFFHSRSYLPYVHLESKIYVVIEFCQKIVENTCLFLMNDLDIVSELPALSFALVPVFMPSLKTMLEGRADAQQVTCFL